MMKNKFTLQLFAAQLKSNAELRRETAEIKC